MIVLSTPIAVPNLTRVGVRRVEFDDDAGVAIVLLEVRSPPGPNRLYGQFRVAIANGDGTPASKSQRLRANASSGTYGDAILVDGAIEIVNGYANLKAAWYGAANNEGARRRAAEQQGITDGWLDSSLGGTVS